jgi:glutaredoxin 3
MTRTSLALAALWLLACSPVESDDAQAESAAPAAARPNRAPAAPAPRAPRDQSAAKAGKGTWVETGGAYQYVDESGRVRFAARLEDVPERQRSTAGHISVAPAPPRRAAPKPESEEARATTNAPVVVYTTRTCPYCRAAIAYMERIGQDYENKDVEADEDAREEYLQVTGGERGVPVIVVGRAWMQGWNQRQFDKLLADSR